MKRHSLRDSKRPEFYGIPKKHSAGLKRKRKKKDPRTYSEEALLRAAEAYYLSGMSRNYAARLHRVPPYQIHKIIDNIKSVFTYGQEKELASKILKMVSRGFEFSETDIRRLAYDFAEKKKLEHNFCSIKKMAGIEWILSFKKANPDIPMIQESSNDPSQPEKPTSKDIISNYCNILNDTMNQSYLVNSPQLIYHVDKAAFITTNNIKKGARKRNVTMVTADDAVTMLICANAAGQSIPPMAICYGKKKALKARHLPQDTLITTWNYEDPGEDIFARWLRHFRKHRNPGLCLLLLDGNPWHKTFQAIDFCEKNKIQMLCMPKQNLRPLSRIVAELKSNYNSNYLNVEKIAGSQRFKHSFSVLFSDALIKAATPAAIRDGFSEVGIYPLNIKSIQENVLLSSSSCTENSPLTIYSGDELTTEEVATEQREHEQINMNVEKSNLLEGTDRAIFPLPLNTMVCIKQEILSEMSVDITPNLYGPISGQTIPMFGNVTAENNHRSSTMPSHAENSPNSVQKLCSLGLNSLPLSAPVDELKEDLAETCLFCYVKFSDPVSVHLGGIIQCQGEGGELFHQRCVGAKENEEFICGRCIISRFRARLVH